MNLKCQLVEKTSSKTGKVYYVASIDLGAGAVKDVFLDKTEIALIKMTYASNQK